MRARVVAAVAMLAFSGCGPDGEPAPPSPLRTLTLPTNVTRIDVCAPDSHILKSIADPAGIARVLAFLTAHRTGWRYSNVGFPTPPIELLFYRGGERLGRFGAGRYRADCRDPSPGYFETDLASDGTLHGESEADLSAYLSLLAMPDFSLDTDDC